jgi:hypothetical protein
VTLDGESALNLAADEVAVAEFLDANGGHLERDDRLDEPGDPAVYWLAMRPRTAADEEYVARVEWFVYPYNEPSIRFADGVRGALSNVRAWPLITGYRAASFDICRPMTREGYAVHPEWRTGSTAWPTEGNPFLWVVQTMQFHLDNEYQGRAA